ncbi:MAG: hypothetical protein KUG78_19335 [Kangiellaceae bacterium]|nr:hypothetical protein [Kangiellaceae bacterium]
MSKHLLKLIIILTTALNHFALAQTHEKTEILILGTYHFQNPGLDVIKSTTFDHLSKKTQQEIALVNSRLVGFNPDKVFIERPVTYQKSINKTYQQYLHGTFGIDKKANEIYQLGFKVAAQLEHKEIYTVDAPGVFPYDELEEGIRRFGLTGVTKALEKVSKGHKESDKADASRTVIERLVNINRPENILSYHMFYTDLATQVISPTPQHRLEASEKIVDKIKHIMVPLDPDYIGAELAAEWYKRNIKIYANIYKRVNKSTDKKILLIIGAGHVRILQHMFEDNPNFELVNTNSILIDN